MNTLLFAIQSIIGLFTEKENHIEDLRKQVSALNKALKEEVKTKETALSNYALVYNELNALRDIQVLIRHPKQNNNFPS